MRKPTLQEQADAWKALAFRLNLYRNISMSNDGVTSVLNRVDNWVNAHGTANGERSDKEVDANIAEAFWKFIAVATPTVKEKKNIKPK